MPPTCTIQRMDLDGSNQETFASNMRNPASIAFQPSTGRLFFTNMVTAAGRLPAPAGCCCAVCLHVVWPTLYSWPVEHFALQGRDLLGDNMPDDTLMSPSRAGLDYMFPFCHWQVRQLTAMRTALSRAQPCFSCYIQGQQRPYD